jgi:uncharacterized protein YndB with AHSA1/START domain
MNQPAAHAAPVVRKTVIVAAPLAVAFEVFTARIETWWPMPSHHIGAADCAAVLIEPWVGGRWFERGVDGSECPWGEVLVWDPPHRVCLAWRLDHAWQYRPSLLTEVDVRFAALGAGGTRVELEHRGLQAYGGHAAEMQQALGSPAGWAGMLEHYAQVAAR